jgi:hypothetical protein
MEALLEESQGWSKGIHSVNKVPRPYPPRCTYYHQINQCPFIKNNVRQGFAKHFQNLNPKLARAKDHGDFEPKDLYHERVKIPNRFREQIWKNNIVEMKVQIVVDVVLIL